jgi:hypothetical protein
MNNKMHNIAIYIITIKTLHDCNMFRFLKRDLQGKNQKQIITEYKLH